MLVGNFGLNSKGRLIWAWLKLNWTPIKMLFLANKLVKKAKITILLAQETTRPGLQAGASWVKRKGYIRGGV